MRGDSLDVTIGKFHRVSAIAEASGSPVALTAQGMPEEVVMQKLFSS
jgi:hypothetical protein